MADEDPSRAWRGSTTNLRERDEEALDDDEDDLGVMSMSDDEGEGSTRYAFIFRETSSELLTLFGVDIRRTSITQTSGYQGRTLQLAMSVLLHRAEMKCDFLTIYLYFISALSLLRSVSITSSLITAHTSSHPIPAV